MTNQLQSDETFPEFASSAAISVGEVADAPKQRLKLRVVSSPKVTAPRRSPQSPATPLALAVAQAIAIVATGIVAGELYHRMFLGVEVSYLLTSVAIGLLSAIFFCGAMYVIEQNQNLRDHAGAGAIRDVTFVWGVTILLVTFFAFSFKAGEAVSRGFMLSFMVLGYLSLLLVRTTVPGLAARHLRSSRFMDHQVIVVGAEDDVAINILLGELENAGHVTPHVITFKANGPAIEWQRELPRTLERVISRARVGARGEICIAAGGFSDGRLKDVVAGLQIVPRTVRVVPSPAIEQFLHFPVRNIGNLYSVELQRAPLNTVQLMAKRAVDFVFATAALAILSPLLLLVSVGILLDSRGPLLFKQTRLGLRGAPFDIYKFRTMTVTENGDDVKQAKKGDSRVTRIGRWLRPLSIDELPQLLNVIRGEMSLVGPRPHASSMDKHYSELIESYEVRQHVKPGMTGWAQVNGLRGPTEAPELMRKRVEYDIWYAKNASLLLDFKILLLTCVEVLRRRNAH